MNQRKFLWSLLVAPACAVAGVVVKKTATQIKDAQVVLDDMGQTWAVNTSGVRRKLPIRINPNWEEEYRQAQIRAKKFSGR